MAENEIRYLGDLQRLDLREGDRFVLTIDGPISSSMHDIIQRQWRRFVGADTEKFPLLVLDKGSKLGVINGEAK